MKKEIIELMKFLFVSPKALSALIESKTKVLALSKNLPMDKEYFDAEKKESLKKLFSSDEFLSGFTKNFEDTFTPNEISTLVQWYSSPEVKKLFELYETLSLPIFDAIGNQIQFE